MSFFASNMRTCLENTGELTEILLKSIKSQYRVWL